MAGYVDRVNLGDAAKGSAGGAPKSAQFMDLSGVWKALENFVPLLQPSPLASPEQLRYPAGQPTTQAAAVPANGAAGKGGGGSITFGSSDSDASELAEKLASRIHGVKRSEIDKVIKKLKLSKEDVADLLSRLAGASASKIWNEMKTMASAKKEETTK